MTKSIYSFERTELRTLQNTCKDNEEFLNALADLVGNLTKERDNLKISVNELLTQIRIMEDE